MRIKNWSKFQHFKDRKPPWVKLYRDLLDDMEWHQLDAEASKILVMLWLIASENEGNLPDIKTLAFRLRMAEKQVNDCVDRLGHWVEHGDIKSISSQHHEDTPAEFHDSATVDLTPGETETETETEGEAAPLPMVEKPKGRAKSTDLTFADWMAKVATAGEKPIPDGDPIFAYAENINLTDEFLKLAWLEFKKRYANNPKKYKDWRDVYRNAVRGNWMNIWRASGEGYVLTTVGVQAQREREARQGVAA